MGSNELQALKIKFDTLRTRWKENLLGIYENNLEDSDIKRVVEETTKKL